MVRTFQLANGRVRDFMLLTFFLGAGFTVCLSGGSVPGPHAPNVTGKHWQDRSYWPGAGQLEVGGICPVSHEGPADVVLCQLDWAIKR